MDIVQVLTILAYIAALSLGAIVLGRYMAGVFSGKQYGPLRFLSVLENLTYRFCGVDPQKSMGWREYTWALLAFNLVGFLSLFIILLTQQWLPLNPQHFPNLSWHLALNTAVSFMTNTNWQAYSGESTLSYFSQMIGLAVHNFTSAATGIAVLLVLIRAFIGRQSTQLGNFWTDLVRSCVHVLLPLSIIFACFLVSQGVVQTFKPYATATTLEGAEQVIPLGPAASQIAIKQIGTNGGGFFGVNSAHPFENPTPLSNFLEVLAILLLPAAQVVMFGVMIKQKLQARAILIAMGILLACSFAVGLAFELAGNPTIGPGVSWEGKEQRFSATDSLIWATATTAASNGSVNTMHDSLTPIGGMVCLVNLLLGEVVFGGVGVGLVGMLMMVILTVFISGLMVGRTPEYLGKKIEEKDIWLALLVIIVPGIALLIGAAISCLIPLGYTPVSNPGPHGLSQILYAFASGVGNNGSAFAGIGVNTPYYNSILATAMLIGRFVVIVPTLMLAGQLVNKQIKPPSSGTFATDGGLFIVLLVSVVLIVGALTYFPALLLGPVADQLLMQQGRVF